jgi:hypothetical protein
MFNTNETTNTNDGLEFELDLCPICLEVGDNTSITMECGHMHHDKCIKDYILSVNNDKYECPLCRSDFSLNKDLRLPILKKEYIENLRDEANHSYNYKFHKSFKYLCKGLRSDEDIIKLVVTRDKSSFKYVPEPLKNNEDFIIHLMYTSNVFKYLSSELKNNKEFLVKLAKSYNNPHIFYKYFSNQLKNDEELALIYIKKNVLTYIECFDVHKNDINFIKKALIVNHEVYEHISINKRKEINNVDIMKELITTNINMYVYLQNELKNSDEFIIELFDILSKNNETVKNNVEQLFEQVRHHGTFLPSVIVKAFSLNNDILQNIPCIKLITISLTYTINMLNNYLFNTDNNMDIIGFENHHITFNGLKLFLNVIVDNWAMYLYIINLMSTLNNEKIDITQIQQLFSMCLIVQEPSLTGKILEHIFTTNNNEYINFIVESTQYNVSIIKYIEKSLLSESFFLQLLTIEENNGKNNEQKLENICVSIDLIYENIPNDLKNNCEFMLKITKLNNKFYNLLPCELKAKNEFMFCNINVYVDEMTYKTIPNDLKIQENIVEQIIETCCEYNSRVNSNRYKYMMEFIEEILEINPELIHCIIKADFKIFKKLENKYKENGDLIISMAKKNEENAYVYQWVSKNLKNNQQFTQEMVGYNGFIFQYIPIALKENINIILSAVRDINTTFDAEIENIKLDKNMCREYSNEMKNIFKYVSDKDNTNPEIVKCCDYYNQICAINKSIIPGKQKVIRVI